MIFSVVCIPEVWYLYIRSSFFLWLRVLGFCVAVLWGRYFKCQCGLVTSMRQGLTGIDISGILHVTHDENIKIPEEDGGSWILREMVLCVS